MPDSAATGPAGRPVVPHARLSADRQHGTGHTAAVQRARRRALLIGVRTFPKAPPQQELPTGYRDQWDELVFAHDRVRELADVIAALEYDVETIFDPSRDRLRTRIEKHFDTGTGPTIVHVVSHGSADADQPDRLDVVPSCGNVGIGTNVSEWISASQALGRPTLFLVDLCQGGRAARPDWLRWTRDADIKAWVIAAAWRDEDAYDGRFSSAVATVLRRCTVDGLGTAAAYRYVGFDRLAQCVGDELARHSAVAQLVTASKVDPAQGVELPFIPNPNFDDQDGDPVGLSGIDAPLRTFVDDDIADALHFTSRAGLHFTGRYGQLTHLAPWIDNEDADAGLRLVTGSPGSGKSALLGVLISAAHPEVIKIMPQIRARLGAIPERCPSPNPHLAAVHARQRTIAELTSSIARQLGLPDTGDPATLITDVRRLGRQPVIALDALDEAIDPAGIQAVLLLPLATGRRDDGRAACRLVVGVRPWWDLFEPLRRLARQSGEIIDLDDVDPEALHADVRQYVSSALSEHGGYADGELRAVREQIADEIAARLTAARLDQTDGQQWGSFLVAHIYVQHLKRGAPAGTPAQAAVLASAVPTDLPSMFELELEDHDADPARLRAVLAALAFAKGDGMPIDLVALVASQLAGRTFTTTETIRLLLDEGRFYIRTAIEQDATTQYRLFHQGLADHLRRRPYAPLKVTP